MKNEKLRNARGGITGKKRTCGGRGERKYRKSENETKTEKQIRDDEHKIRVAVVITGTSSSINCIL